MVNMIWKLIIFAVLGTSVVLSLEDSYKVTQLGEVLDKSSLKLLKEAYDASENKNVIASPLGVFTLLNMYGNGAGPDVREEIAKALSFETYNALNAAYVDLFSRFYDMDHSFITIANKLILSKDYTLVKSFKDRTQFEYKSKVESVDFSDKEATASAVNKWAEEETEGHIKDPVSSNMFDPRNVAALFNIIFFQGQWHVPFKVEQTKDEDFKLLDKSIVRKPMMHLNRSLFYHENKDLGARLVKLPYKQYGFSMVIVLPDEVDGLPSVLQKVQQNGLSGDVSLLRPSNIPVDFYMPKFEIKSKLNLNDLLPKIGVSKIFTEGATGIVRERPVVVDTAFQDSVLKVDEEGSMAGSFTGFFLMPTSLNYIPPPPIEFHVDHPFMFMILFEDKVIFTGTYSQ